MTTDGTKEGDDIPLRIPQTVVKNSVDNQTQLNQRKQWAIIRRMKDNTATHITEYNSADNKSCHLMITFIAELCI